MFISVFKDYVDYLHELASVITGDMAFMGILKSLVIYVIKSAEVLFWYIVSFKWLLGFSEIPVLFRHTYSSVLNAQSVFDARLELDFDQGFFSFLETGNLNSNNLGTGILNSFFLTLPLSVPQLLTLRALLVNGVPAGVFSALGTLVGQFVFFTCVLFGFEFILVPWLSIHPVLIVVGAGLVIRVVHQMVHNPPVHRVTTKQRKTLFKYFRTTLCLSWFEQICVYSYLGNLTVNGASTVFQTSGQNFLFSTFGYLLGLTIGSIFWTVVWGFVCIALRNFLYNRVLVHNSSTQLTLWFHKGCVALLMTMSLSSFSYYGADFLVGSSLGFTSDDRGLEAMRPTINDDENLFYDEMGLIPARELDIQDRFVAVIPSNQSPIDPQLYEFESYNYAPEQRWKNRELLRTRVSNDDSRKVGGTFIREVVRLPQPISVDPYESYRAQKHEEALAAKALEAKSETADSEQTAEEEKTDKKLVRKSVMDESDQVFARSDFVAPYVDIKDEDYGTQVEVHYSFRKKFFANPVYRSLLQLDMYPFLLGAHRDHAVSAEQEYELYQLRQTVQDYANSLVGYKIIMLKEDGENMGFARHVYNHQFKGSLNVIRQFHFAKVHETVDRKPGDKYYDRTEIDRLKKLKVLKYDQLLNQTITDQDNFAFHEELELATAGKHDSLELSEIGNQSAPMYIGWDGSLRKFLIKTRVTPNQFDVGDEIYADPYTVYNDEDLYDKNGKLKITDKEKEKYDQHSVYFPNAKTKVPKGIPTYYSFQAWSPATENIQLDDKSLSLAAANYTQDDLESLKILLKQVDPSNIKKDKGLSIKDKDAISHFFSNLPNYNWFWGRYGILDEDETFEDGEEDKMDNFRDYFDLGTTAPPRLDGFAWPGVRDPVLIKEVLPRTKVDKDAYLLEDEDPLKAKIVKR